MIDSSIDNLFIVIGALKAVLNGRSAMEDLCLTPPNQRDVIVTRSLLKWLMSHSLRRSQKWRTVGRLMWVGEIGDLALGMTSLKICLQRKFEKANKMM